MNFKSPRYSKPRPSKARRNRRIAQLRSQGQTLAALAARFRLCEKRIYVIVERERSRTTPVSRTE